ncbi:NAD-dependent epimerase/dehydratase family protein [Kribbella sp. NPDC004536]|uniref:NAD-dependent epimerase/dehydratase family protein n=1 Tax=Kribbella sp. NPDC004536 TaxID=3364106 RepID=UPI0036C8FF93
MSVLVTGSAGLIGERVVRALSDRGADVIGVDPAEPARQSADCLQIVGDAGDLDLALRIMDQHGVDTLIVLGYVMHQLFEPDFRDMSAAIRANVLGIANLFEAAVKLNLRRVVLASSIGVYGPQERYGNRPVTEQDFVSPPSLYGQLKALNESVAEWYRDHWSLDVVAVRSAAVLGSRSPLWPADLLNPVARGGTGRAIFSAQMPTNLVWVDDLAQLFAGLGLAERLDHSVYNASGSETTVGEVAAIAAAQIPGATFEFPADGEVSPGYPTNVSSSRAHTELNWTPLPLESAVGMHLEEAAAVAR